MMDASQALLFANHGKQLEETGSHAATSYGQAERMDQLASVYGVGFGIFADDRFERIVIPSLTGFELRQ